jgi:uncharacterized protein YuzE
VHQTQGRQVLERLKMKIKYDQNVDVVTIILKQNSPVDESDEAKPGVILDYDSNEDLVSIEILDASKHMPGVTTMEYELTPQPPRHSAEKT